MAALIRPFGGKMPEIGADTFVAENAVIVGDVIIGARSSIWYGAVLRGDVFHIRIGDETSIQDNSVIHVSHGRNATVVGSRVTVGHSVNLHGCRILDHCIIGMGTIILDGHGRVLNSNRVAGELLALDDGMRVADAELRFTDPAVGRQLQQVIAKVLDAHQRGAAAVVEALRVRRPSGKGDFGLVIRPVPRSAWSEGQSSPTVAVFLSAPEVQSQTSELVIKQLFDFTPAESRLALRLAGGQSLAEACEELCISQHTARAQLKTIFAKSGVTRQAELVRLILRSVATLA